MPGNPVIWGESSRGIRIGVSVSKSGEHSKEMDIGVIRCILGILLCIEEAKYGVLCEKAR